MTIKLPGARAALVDNAGVMTPQFYRFFSSLEKLQDGNASDADIAAINAQLAALQAEIDALPEAADRPTLQATYPILSQGLLQNGFANLALDQPGDTGTGSLLAFVKDAWGRIIGTKAATITGTDGRVTVANGDASTGLPTIDLATVSDTGGGSLLRFVRDAWGRVTGTSAPAVADLKSAGLVVPQGYIDGLQMQWVSGTAVTVSSGAAYIPALGNVLQVHSAIALTGLSLAASTWYHLFLYSNAGTPAVECVTTAPVLYNGTAYQKTSDNTRRYIGSVLTDASGAVYNFIQSGMQINYRVPFDSGIFRVLTGGQALGFTSVSFSGVVPATSRIVNARFTNTDASGAARITTSDASGDPVNGCFGISKNTVSFVPANLNAAQQLQYQYLVAPTGGLYLDVLGYLFGR